MTPRMVRAANGAPWEVGTVMSTTHLSSFDREQGEAACEEDIGRIRWAEVWFEIATLVALARSRGLLSASAPPSPAEGG